MATATLPTEYSMISCQPMIQATSSRTRRRRRCSRAGQRDARGELGVAQGGEPQATAVKTNKRITAGPPWYATLPMVAKMPAPMIAAMRRRSVGHAQDAL